MNSWEQHSYFKTRKGCSASDDSHLRTRRVPIKRRGFFSKDFTKYELRKRTAEEKGFAN
jgi:hypothetical protein